MLEHIAPVKALEREESIPRSSFYRQLPDYQSHIFRLIYSVDELPIKEMKIWSQSKISSYYFCVWYQSRELGGRGRGGGEGVFKISLCNTSGGTFSDKVTFRIPSNINDKAPLRKQPISLTRSLFPQKISTADVQSDSK